MGAWKNVHNPHLTKKGDDLCRTKGGQEVGMVAEPSRREVGRQGHSGKSSDFELPLWLPIIGTRLEARV